MTSNRLNRAALACAILCIISGSGTAGTGTVTVRGVVLSQDGLPIPGSRVIFSSKADVRNMIEFPTAASAGFTVSLLPAMAYNLRVMAPGYPLQYFDQSVPDIPADGPPAARLIFTGGDSITVRCTMTPRNLSTAYGWIGGVVTDSTDAPLPQIRIMALAPGKDVTAEVQTDDQGRYLCRVPFQPHFICASSYNFPVQFWAPSATTSEPTTSGLLAIVPNDTIRATMKLKGAGGSGPVMPIGGGGISGQVLVKGGNLPAQGVIVCAFRPDSMGGTGFNPTYVQTPFIDTVNADGSYQITGMPQGSFYVFARSPKFLTQFYNGADSAQGASRVSVNSSVVSGINFSLRLGGTISGTVAAKGGKPLPMVQVNCNSIQGGHYSQVQTDSLGKFAITGLPAGTYCLNVFGGIYLSNSAVNQCDYKVSEGAALSGVLLLADQGGVAKGFFSGPALPESLDYQGFEIALFPDSLQPSQAPLYERWSAWAAIIDKASGEFVSSGLPAGKWRYLFRQGAGRAPVSSVQPYRAWWAYSFGEAASLSAQVPISVSGGDTVRFPRVSFSRGFSVLGTISLEGGEKGLSCGITAYLRDGIGFVPVSHAYPLSGGSFELAGLVDNQDYFFGVSAPNYPMQFWSPQGSWGKPASSYRFSTSNFISPAVNVVKAPQGIVVTPPSLSAWWAADSVQTGSFKVYCNAPGGMGIDTLFLYGKDAYGSILTIEKFPVGASQNSYTWKGPGSFSQPPRMYVFVGKGPNAAPRSNIVWIDPSLRGNPSAGTFFAWLSQMRSGVQINWRADSSLLSTDADTIIVSKRFGPQTGYKRWSVSRGATGSIWDSDFKEVAAGTTVYYKIEILSTKAVPPSQEVKFDVTREFLDRMPKRLSVGKYGQYATIQLAVDAANDGDVIEIGPAASGVYKEKVSLKGKAVSLEADWRDGAPPVIDAEGGLAILVPYTPKSMDNGTIGIGGLKIINALTGVAAYANVSVHQCLFVNNVREAVLCMVDSAAVVKAALTDPFAQFQINADFWQCTFVGNSSTPVAIRASSGASGAADSSGLIRTQMAPSGYIKVNNSIFFRYASSVLPVDAKDDRVAVSVHNCDFWRTSMAVSSARVKLEAENFQIDPAFKDTVNYFLPDSSSLRGMADNGASVGYDGNRGGSRNGDQGDTGQKAAIPAVRDLKLKVSGPHTIFLSWSPLPDTAVFSAYMVMRVDAVDSRFTVDAQSKWTLTVPKDSILSFIDTFRTAATTFSDTTAIAGRSYIYAVAGVDSTGEIGEVDMPASLPLSAYTVTIGIPAKIGAMTAKIQGFSTINLTWKRPASVSPSTAYEVYRFSGGDSLVAAAGDSARVRRLAFTAKQGGAAVAFAARDTVLIDNVASLGLSYLYIASVADSIIPFESRPLTWTAVKIDSLPYQESRPVSVVANRWNMIGPWGVGATSGDNAGTIVYRWDDDKAADKLYSQYASASALQGGAGYWFKAAADTVLAVTPVMHRAVIQRRDSLFVKLRKGLTGWNQVASPLPFPVSPAWLKNGIFTAYAWEGDSNQYTDQTVLKPWRGYWIHTDRDTTLAVKPSDVAASDLGRPLGKRLSAAAWELQVSLSGDGCDPDNFIGVISPEASRLRKLVYPEPPRAFDYAQLFIVETGGDKAAEPKQCAKLYKVSGADVAKKLEWMVGISPSASAATIRVKGAERLPEKVLLFWISGAAAINLRENAEISVPAHAENVYGYIVATSNPRDVGIYTRSFELRGCFPNPVRNNAVIDFTVPYSWNKDGSKREGETRELTLGVYDMAGRCVATVFSGSVCVGDHRLAWRGASDAGYAVAQGAYVIRLAGGDFQRTLRIMKLR